MSRLAISEKDVIEILRFKQALLDAIPEKLYTIRCDISNTDDIIEMISLSCKTISDMPKGTGGHNDLSEVYERCQNKLRERNQEFIKIINDLINRKEQIHRVWSCFMALNEPYYSILHRRYVQNELYDTVQKESGFSMQVFEKYRKRAISSIIDLYNSDASESELQRMGNVVKDEPVIHHGKESSEQLSIMDWLLGQELPDEQNKSETDTKLLKCN